MKGKLLLSIVLVASLSILPAGSVRGEEKDFGLRKNETVATLLADRVGKPATLILSSGQELTGVVVSVGDSMIHLSKLSGRDFYDAALRLDSVAGVVVRVRGR